MAQADANVPPFDRRRLLRGISSASLGAALSRRFSRVGQAADASGVSLALDWYPNANHAGLFLAAARGRFEAVGIDVEFNIPASSTTVIQTVGAGRDDFGISYPTDLLLARAQGVPVVSIAALVQHPLLVLMSPKSKGITRPADTVGRTVAYPGIASQEAFLAAMLEADGAALADIELIDVGYDLLPAVLSGRVDAIMGAYRTHETIVAELRGVPVDALPVERWGVPDYYELVVITSDETVAERPELVRSFLRATQDGYSEAAVDPDAALTALTAASPETDPAVEALGIATLIPLWTDGVSPFGRQESERWKALSDWMQQRKLLPVDFNPEGAFTASLLPSPPATPSA